MTTATEPDRSPERGVGAEALVSAASGSRTHGAAVGVVSGMRDLLECIKDADIAHYQAHGRFLLPADLRQRIQFFVR